MDLFVLVVVGTLLFYDVDPFLVSFLRWLFLFYLPFNFFVSCFLLLNFLFLFFASLILNFFFFFVFFLLSLFVSLLLIYSLTVLFFFLYFFTSCFLFSGSWILIPTTTTTLLQSKYRSQDAKVFIPWLPCVFLSLWSQEKVCSRLYWTHLFRAWFTR